MCLVPAVSHFLSSPVFCLYILFSMRFFTCSTEAIAEIQPNIFLCLNPIEKHLLLFSVQSMEQSDDCHWMYMSGVLKLDQSEDSVQ